ncbi:MAG: NYN domain-containing protein [Desulfovibrionaceae bacterium]
MPQIKSALFVDFDNIFITLQDQSPEYARAFATQPGRWLAWLETFRTSRFMGEGRHRRILTRKCYLNPSSFYDYRPYFIRAAFDVVDCPQLTRQGKTAADIHMVLDMLETLNHSTNFDEFILLSGDSDFTPVLIKLREYDRRTVVLSTGFTSPAYKSASDFVIFPDVFLRYGLGVSLDADTEEERPRPAATSQPEPQAPLLPAETATSQEATSEEPSREGATPEDMEDMQDAPPPPSEPAPRPEPEEQRPQAAQATPELLARAAALIREKVGASPRPVPLAALAQHIQARLGGGEGENGWFGDERFSTFLARLDLAPLLFVRGVPGYVYDPEIHEPPEDCGAAPLAGEDPDLVDLAHKVHALTDTPLLSPGDYKALFAAIAEEVNANGYGLTATSKAVRDAMVEDGVPLSRGTVNFVLVGIGRSGFRYGRSGPDTARDIAAAFAENVHFLCRGAQFELTTEQMKLLLQWLVKK